MIIAAGVAMLTLWLLNRPDPDLFEIRTPEERAADRFYTMLGTWSLPALLPGIALLVTASVLKSRLRSGKGGDPKAQLADILAAAHALVARPGNDFTWSPWKSASEILSEFDTMLSALGQGRLPDRLRLLSLFISNGPIQNLSVTNGWTRDFFALAQRLDTVAARLWPEALEA